MFPGETPESVASREMDAGGRAGYSFPWNADEYSLQVITEG
jgi:hypothetical protein